ncbi:NAD binding domain of 6-phosphogluconate dehydrogenase-domain-containing protein [Phaeosphaeriaceae sp. PMI808]|nr:NAD binding domain of 6-phosphogluconate dehydrogenase-domain-containing protein [Phaeosphaeriaceae sp. PMI808]
MPAQDSLHLGWIGLGSMGLAMATNIQKHLTTQQSPALKYWNRTLSRGDPLQKIGGAPCSSIEELVQLCDIIFISVSDDEALKSLIKTLTSTPSITNKIIVDTTTVHPATTASTAAQFHAKSVSYVAAPVFGSTPVAQAGNLLIALAGAQSALETISPFLKGVLARAVITVGNEPEKALLLKTTSNFITAGLMYLLSEAHTLASVSGLPLSVLHDLVEQNFGAYAAGVSERLISGAYCPAPGVAPRSGLELGIKDVGHGVNLAKEKGMELQIGELYLNAARDAKEWGDDRGRSLDSSAVFGIVRSKAGERFESEAVLGKEGKESKQ